MGCERRPARGRAARLIVPKSLEPIRVEIYDQEYSVRGELDADYLQQLGRFLDARMRAVAERSRTVDSLRVAILAALNLADEYHRLKSKYESVSEDVARRAEACSALLDDVLREKAG